ncbi:hypothetical protein JCM10213v2_001147 [Rhodosporidiobolus nylandii]
MPSLTGQKRARAADHTQQPSPVKRRKANSTPFAPLDASTNSSGASWWWPSAGVLGTVKSIFKFADPSPATLEAAQTNGVALPSPSSTRANAARNDHLSAVPSSFSPSRPSGLSSVSDAKLGTLYGAARAAWFRETMKAQRDRRSQPQKSPTLVALEAEANRRIAAGGLKKSASATERVGERKGGKVTAVGSAAADSAGTGSGFRKRKPLGGDKHKDAVDQRDRATLDALRQGATVKNPLVPEYRGGSGSSEAPEADDDFDPIDMLSADRGVAEKAELKSRRAAYLKLVEEGEATRVEDQSSRSVDVAKHRSSISRLKRQHRTPNSIIHPQSYFPAASDYLRSKSTASAKPSKIPTKARRPGSTGVDRALECAKKSLQEPPAGAGAFETFEAMQRRLIELGAREDVEDERQKKRVFPETLPPDYQKLVSAAFKNRSFKSEIKGALVQAADLRRLLGTDWLNDETINFIGVLINHRSDDADKAEKAGDADARGESEKKLRKAFCFNTNFYNMLTQGGVEKGFDKVKRWTRRFDTFEKDIIIIPINLGGAHWVCAAVNIAQKRIEYYDSLGPPRDSVYRNLRRWLEKEHLNRKKTEIDLSDWENYWDEDRPEQQNTHDCGVFTCMFMECLSREVEGFDFTQDNMPYLRNKLALIIEQKELLDIEDWE